MKHQKKKHTVVATTETPRYMTRERDRVRAQGGGGGLGTVLREAKSKIELAFAVALGRALGGGRVVPLVGSRRVEWREGRLRT